MVILGLVQNDGWREALRGAVAVSDELTFVDDVPSAVTAHRGRAATLIVVDSSAFPDFDLAPFGAEATPDWVALAPDAEADRAALRAGAADCETEPTAARIARRIEVARARQAKAQERKRSELDYRQLFETSHDAILILDPVGEVILDINPRGCEAYGRPREEMLGLSLKSFSQDPERGLQRVRETMGSQAVIRFETVQYRRGGEAMLLDVIAWRIDYRGRPAILSINRDVTAKEAHALELRKRDLALAEASKLEAVGRLAGGIAHDFNNLLMVIGGCTEVMAMGHDDSSPFAEEIADLEGAFTRAKALVRQLLTFARQGPTQIRTFKLLDVLEPLRGILRRLVREEVDLVTDIGASAAVCVRMDPSQLEQVVINLVANARDAIVGVGTVRIAVELDRPEGVVHLRFADDGCGMDEATRLRAFEPFFTTKELGRGTGLGLATVHGIVTAAGGGLSVVSAPGKGAEVSVSLPIANEAPQTVAPLSGRRRSQPGAESILLVEDEQAVRRLLARELRRSGYEVLESENGVAALELADRHPEPIDVLVTDIVMPKMSGDELARRLLASRPELKIVFMSGHAERHVLRKITDAGMGPLLTKPFVPAKLMEAVRAVLEFSQN